MIGDRRQYVHQVGNLHISCWGKGATCGEKTHELQVVSKCPQDLFIEAEKHANSRIMAPYREQSIEDRVTKDKKQREVSSPKTFENDKLNDFLLPASAEYVNVDCDNPDRQDLQISEDEDKDEDDNAGRANWEILQTWLEAGYAYTNDFVKPLATVTFTNLSFKLAYTLLQCFGVATNDEGMKIMSQIVARIVPEVEEDMVECFDQRISDCIPKCGTSIRAFGIVQASATLSFLTMAIASSQGCDGLPIPTRTPFLDALTIPSVQNTSKELVSACHDSRMNTADFLSGRWRGFYSDHRRVQNRKKAFIVDPPMLDIQMIVQEPTLLQRSRQDISAVVTRETKGHDAHGKFRLSGHVTEDGMVRLVKQYNLFGISIGEFTWTGRITPFGIVGVWGQSSFGGYFWIFKDEWVECRSGLGTLL